MGNSVGAAWRVWVCALLLAPLVNGCGGSNATTVLPTITISLSAASTAITPAGSTVITAVVNNDAAGKGVTWTLSGTGTLSGATATTVTYTAPAAVTGAIVPVIVATSVSDTLIQSEVGVTVNGTPVLQQPRSFPGNQNVAYSLPLSILGGVAPYTWTQTAGTLPAGLVFNASTTAANSITGTPTVTGTFPISVSIADSTGATSAVSFNVVVDAQSTCLLRGRFVYQMSGYHTNVPAVRVGQITVADDGTVTGVEDYSEPTTSRVASVITAGTCVTTAANYGTLNITAGGIASSYIFAVFDSLEGGRIQENDSNGIVISGRLVRQSGVAAATIPTGDFGFTFGGDDGNGNRIGIAGRATLAADGSFSNARADASGAFSVVAGAVSGSLGAEDATGRGIGSVVVAGQTLPVIYYQQNPDTLLLIGGATGSGTPRITGQFARQNGEPYSLASLTGPAILELWGAEAATTTSGPHAVTSLARLSGLDPVGGTAQIVLDRTVQQPLQTSVAPVVSTDIYQTFAGATIQVDADGRVDVNAPAASNPRHYVLYLTGASSGFGLEYGSATGDAGILEAQEATPLAQAPTAVFVSSTELGTRQSPQTLLPQLNVTPATFAASSISASHAADLTTGRGVGVATANYFGGTNLIYYIVQDNRIVLMGDGTGTGTAINWLEH